MMFFKRKPRQELRTHDRARPNVWGDAVYWKPPTDGLVLEAYGFGGDHELGDYMIFRHPGSTETTRYRIKTLKWCADPRDMWFATLEFAPRS